MQPIEEIKRFGLAGLGRCPGLRLEPPISLATEQNLAEDPLAQSDPLGGVPVGGPDNPPAVKTGRLDPDAGRPSGLAIKILHP